MSTLVPIPGFNKDSLRAYARCLGVRGEFQVVRDFFGYATGAPKEISLLRQMKRMGDYHVSLNVIRVGIESFTESDEEEIDAAIDFARDTFGDVNFGIGKVERYSVTLDDANGRNYIGNDAEAEDLTHEWSVDNFAIDAFFVGTYVGSKVGLSPVKGPENKDRNGPMTGIVIAIEGTQTVTAFALAQCVASYIGLNSSEHEHNLMFPTVPNGGNLTSAQRQVLIDGPFVLWGCGLMQLVLSGGH